MKAFDILSAGPVIPVITIDELDIAVPLAKALVRGGIRVLEVTLRTPSALEAINAISREVPDALVGAGTILNSRDLQQAREAGACFGISPGTSSHLLAAASAEKWPYLPGVMTPTEIMIALDAGFNELKFFPAAQAGGIAMLKAFIGPFPHVTFCPTGGIQPIIAPDYLSLGNVACVGGSWLTPTNLVQARDWDGITQLAKQAASLAKS